MPDTSYAVVPSPRTDFVELARTPLGRLFKKQILKFGEWEHPHLPGEKLVIDRSMARQLVDNFKKGVVDIVQVPVADDSNNHVEDPFRNIGEVIDLSLEDDGVYATIDVRKTEAAESLGKTLIGASAMLHLNYKDTKSGRQVGPTLLHTLVTNRPYLSGLKGYEEVIAASDAIEDGSEVVFLGDESSSNNTDISKEQSSTSKTEGENMPELTREDLLRLLKDEHGIDVEALQRPPTAAHDELVSKFTNVLKEAGVLNLSKKNEDDPNEVTILDVAEAVIELSEEKKELDTKVQTLTLSNQKLEQERAAAEVDDLVKQGRVLPVQRDAMLELSLSNREMFDKLVPDQAVVDLSARGVETHEEPKSEKFDEEVERLRQKALELTNGRRK